VRVEIAAIQGQQKLLTTEAEQSVGMEGILETW
jgi:hypothetical protein